MWSLKNSTTETLYLPTFWCLISAFPDSLTPAIGLLSNGEMCKILLRVKGNILNPEVNVGFACLVFIYSSSNIYWTFTMADIYHLAKVTLCVPFLKEEAEIYRQHRCRFCSQVFCASIAEDTLSSQSQSEDLSLVTE